MHWSLLWIEPQTFDRNQLFRFQLTRVLSGFCIKIIALSLAHGILICENRHRALYNHDIPFKDKDLTQIFFCRLLCATDKGIVAFFLRVSAGGIRSYTIGRIQWQNT